MKNIKKKKKFFFRNKKLKKNKLEGKAYIRTTRNNTIITVTDLKGNTLNWSSSGACGLKGARKETPVGARRVAERMAQFCLKKSIRKIHVCVTGTGFGRESAIRCLRRPGLIFGSLSDSTTYSHNGCRPPKKRRL